MTPEERNEAHSYAWDYFALHAEQRMKLFYFFLILSGLILNAIPAIRNLVGNVTISSFVPLLLVMAAIIFSQLDKRTRILVKNAEDALRYLDEQWSVEPLPDKTPHYLHLIERDDYFKKTREQLSCVVMSYTYCFRIAHIMIGGFGLLLTILMLLK